MKKEKEFEIPIEGSLGLLALGARGLLAWREKRDANQNSEARTGENE